MISHDIHVTCRICDHLAVLHHGQIIERCDTMTSLEQLPHPASFPSAN
jgi:ABC-type dipeptide/oligopeptide/nickel transport system ATPase component